MASSPLPAGTRTRESFLVWALAMVGPVLLLGPMLLRGEVLFWGTPLLQFYPWHSFAIDVVRGGQVPLWNPYLGMGAPLLANQQSALLYPANWLLLLIDPAWGHGVLVLLHLIWTAGGMLLLAKRLGASPLGQVVAAQAWALSTFLVSRSGFLSLNAAAAWLPWVLLLGIQMSQAAAHAGRARQMLRGVVGLGVVLALQVLAGHAQTTWYTIVLAVGLSWVTCGGSGRAFLRWAAAWVGVAALAFGLSAAQVLPSAEYLLQSSRASGLEASTAFTYSFWPWRTLGLLLPGLFGNPALGDYWGYGNYWEDALYVGILPLMMALSAVIRMAKFDLGRRRVVAFLGLAGLTAFLLALGSNNPLYPWLYRTVPSFDMFQAPTRWNIVTTACLALLAGVGAGLWSPPSPPGIYWRRLGVAGAAALAVVALALLGTPSDLSPSMPRSLALLGGWLAVAWVLQLRWPAQITRLWLVLAAGIVGADLLWANAGILPAASPSLYHAPSDLGRQVEDGHRLYLPADLEYEVKFERLHRFDTFDPGIDWLQVREAGLPNTPMMEAIPSANNFDPLVADSYVGWISLVEAKHLDEDLLALADIGWLGEPAGPLPPWVIYRAVEGAARVRIVQAARPVDSRDDALELLRAGVIDPESVVLLEGAPDSEAAQRGAPGQAEILPGDNPNVVRVKTDTPDGGWLLLSDTWYPGWASEVDGAEVPMYRADGVFRALWTPPGKHEATFVYRPWTFSFGVLLSGVAWAAILMVGLRWRLD